MQAPPCLEQADGECNECNCDNHRTRASEDRPGRGAVGSTFAEMDEEAPGLRKGARYQPYAKYPLQAF